MSDPKRLRDLDPALGELLSEVEAPRPMTSLQRRRMARRVGQTAALPAAAGAMVWAKGLAFATLLGAAGGVTLAAVEAWYDEPAEVRHAAPAEPAAPKPSPEPTPAESKAPAPSPTLEEPSEPAAPSLSASAQSQGDSLAREAAQLEAARRLLDRDPAGALQRLAAHAAEFPRGALGMEREILRTDALQRLGRHAEARAHARAILATNPDGLYAERLRALLAREP